MSALPTIKRFTTEYVDVEDRIRLSCEMEEGQQIIWLTQRLLGRLLPLLFQWLESQKQLLLEGSANFTYSKNKVHIEDASSDVSSWLPHSVDIVNSKEVISLTFKSGDGHLASVALAADLLRQWLEVLHETYLIAQWPQDVWPAWVAEGALVLRTQQPTVWH